MKRIKSKSDIRLILECTVNDKTAYFLVDTGATVGLINSERAKKFDLKSGRKYNGDLIGVGGKINDVRCCDTFVYVDDRCLTQFLLTDLSSVVSSIKNQTDIEILGIISLPQLKLNNMSIDCNDNEIILE